MSVDQQKSMKGRLTYFQYSETYPSVLCVPSVISDTTLKHTASFRSKARIPVLTYFHSVNDCTITRSAQPSVGIRQSRSPQDEKLVNAIFGTTKPSLAAPRSGVSTPQNNQSSAELGEAPNEIANGMESLNMSTSTIEDNGDTIDIPTLPTEKEAAQIVRIYGAQQTNMIIDARPSVNAMAQHALGYGSENMEGYPNAKKLFLGIDNIHVMRKSLEDLVDALKDFEGTMIFVSHDRMFLRGLGSRVLELGGESGRERDPRVYPGSYDEYVQTLGHEAPGIYA